MVFNPLVHLVHVFLAAGAVLAVIGTVEQRERRCDLCRQRELIIMRRYMMRIAQAIAEKNGAIGLITGESIGQVASQTLQSLAATNEVCTMPVYRPVIGFDKQEIVDHKEYYGLDTSNNNVPDLSTEPALAEWINRLHLNVFRRFPISMDAVSLLPRRL